VLSLLHTTAAAGNEAWQTFPDKMADHVGSIELWAASKFIGRECATVNKEYLLCKKHEGESVSACLNRSEAAIACGANV
jgi:hypothetical protein